MQNIEANLDRFIRLQVFKSRAKPFWKFVLRHAAPGKKGREVDLFEIPDSFDGDQVDSKVGEIMSRAQMDADGMGGLQRYELTAHEQGERAPCARLAFRLRGGDEEFDDQSGEEGPDMKGLVAQQMRHNEALVRIFTTSMASAMSTMTRRMESLDQTNERMMKQRMESFEALEEAKSQQHDRDMELMVTSQKEARNDKAFEKIMLLVPAVINKLAGKSVMESKDPLALALKSLAESLSTEQLQGIAAKLEPSQQIVLFQLIQSVKSTKQLPESSSS